jgi:hypothetical protein
VECDGYGTPKALLPDRKAQKCMSQPPLSENMNPGMPICPPGANDRDNRQLDFVRNQTELQLSGNFDASFWNCLLLQIGHSEPTVWHSIIAVGSLHEQYILNYSRSNHRSDANRQLALDHYNKAISRLTMIATENQESVVRDSCELFIIRLSRIAS